MSAGRRVLEVWGRVLEVLGLDGLAPRCAYGNASFLLTTEGETHFLFVER